MTTPHGFRLAPMFDRKLPSRLRTPFDGFPSPPCGQRETAMGEQADRREPFDAQKEYDEATPIPISDERIEEIVKAVCRSPSAYHPKLAEAIVAKVNTTKDWLANNIRHAVLAVLASEGVVDPEEYDKAIKRWQNGCYAAELKVERLEAGAAEADHMLELAIKGRLMTSVSLHPVEVALAALRSTGENDE